MPISSLNIVITNWTAEGASGPILANKATEVAPKKITPVNGAAKLPALYVIVSLSAGLPGGAYAADSAFPQPEPAVASADPITEHFATWYDRVDAAQASQPHWMTPITTVTPRLQEEYRYDQFQQFLGNGAEVNNYFGAKGLELIPTTTNEILIKCPSFRTAHAGSPNGHECWACDRLRRPELRHHQAAAAQRQ
jgi:hypothetical protein